METIGTRDVHSVVFQIVQSCHPGRWGRFSRKCVKYAAPLVLLDLPTARRKQRDDSVTTGEMTALQGLLERSMWLATQVIPQLQAPLPLLLGYVGIARVSIRLEAYKLARHALFWVETSSNSYSRQFW